MAILTGGIFSRPRGKTGGIVFGAARTRRGKLVTSRLLVPPSNPNTTAQQQQRTKFSNALSLVRTWGPTIYQSDFNRAVGQLPGFQSLESLMLNQLNSTFNLVLTTPVNLGTLHVPDTITGSTGGAFGEIDVTWSTENGSNGTSNDIAVLIMAANDPNDRSGNVNILSSQSIVRSAGATGITLTFNSDGLDVSGYLYFRGAGVASGILSLASIVSGTTGP